jgi:hypothetical protein
MFVLLSSCAAANDDPQQTRNAIPKIIDGGNSPHVDTGEHHMNIKIAIGTTTLKATLDDNPTARDFASLLPITVKLEDFNSSEKITGELPKPLSQEGAPAAAAGAVGDIAYYAPWGNLALFYQPGPNARGLIKMGRITSGIEALKQPGTLRVTISRDNLK